MARKKSTPPQSQDKVTLVDDPFGISTLEISEAQGNEDFVPEMSEEETDTQLGKLARAMQDEQEKNETRLEEQAVAHLADPEDELRQQIEEDEALNREIAEAQAEEARAPSILAQAQAQGALDANEVESCIEALLFMSDRPVSLQKIREYLGPEIDASLFKDALSALKARYESAHHGFEPVEIAGGYQFRTKPGKSAIASKLAKIQTQRLSRGAMETLAIIAYKQPVLKEDIDKIRGVDSSHFIRGLLEKKLIQMAGRSELPGRPIVYETSQEFLEIFSLRDLSSLPPLCELEQMVPASQSENPEDEDPKVREMRRLVGEMKADKHRIAYDPKEDEKLLTEIRDRVKSIPSSTPYLDELKAQEKGDAQAAPATPPTNLFELPVPGDPPTPESDSDASVKTDT